MTLVDYTIETITAAEARPLRRALLHPGLALDATDYPGDADDLALHVGSFLEGVLVGIGTIHPQPLPADSRAASWRVRDLAVEHGHRGRGLGALILGHLLEHAADHGGKTAWAAVRVGAVGFFEHRGFSGFDAPWADPNEGQQRLLISEVRPLVRDWKLPAEAES